MTMFIPLSRGDDPGQPSQARPSQTSAPSADKLTRALAERVADQSELLSRRAERLDSKSAALAAIDELAVELARLRDELRRRNDVGPISLARLTVAVSDAQAAIEGAERLAGLEACS